MNFIKNNKDILIATGSIILLAFCLAQAAITYGESSLEKGRYYPVEQNEYAFFRSDSTFYYQIADTGYAYNGDLKSTPNIVFAPLYSLTVRYFDYLSPFSLKTDGFIINWLYFLPGLFLLGVFLKNEFDTTTAIIAMAGIALSAGSFAYQAFYSESTMLFWMAISFLLLQKEKYLLAGLCTGILSASRLTAGPICLVIALLILYKLYLEIKSGNKETGMIAKMFLASGLCLSGMLLYLAFIWRTFSNPFTLIPAIQQNSWQYFHEPIAIWEIFIPHHLFTWWGEAFQRSEFFLFDPLTTCLSWTTLALISVIYALFRIKSPLIKWGFIGYYVLIYYSNAGTHFLSSTHRYFTLMLPLFIMFAEIYKLIKKKNEKFALIYLIILAAIHLIYFFFTAAHFTMGHSYFF